MIDASMATLPIGRAIVTEPPAPELEKIDQVFLGAVNPRLDRDKGPGSCGALPRQCDFSAMAMENRQSSF
jgi:hypothetical protein